VGIGEHRVTSQAGRERAAVVGVVGGEVVGDGLDHHGRALRAAGVVEEDNRASGLGL